MYRRIPYTVVLLAILWPIALPLVGQQASPPSKPYTIRVPVNEINLIFHATDAHTRQPLTHLTRQDLTLTDNNKPQTRITALQSFADLPIRGGFLFDASPSMTSTLGSSQQIMQLYATRLLRPGVDQAFLLQFDDEILPLQDWTDSNAALGAAARRIGPHPERLTPTAIFDTLYKLCRDRWAPFNGTATGNFILLFSDGLDNASHVYLSEAVDMCQRTGTAIYAVTYSRRTHFLSERLEGQQILEALAAQTGGHVFYAPQGANALAAMQQIEAEQRQQYRLTYLESDLVPDGSFHRVKLKSRTIPANFTVRSGYYALARR